MTRSVAALSLIPLLLSCSCSGEPGEQRRVDLGTHSLHATISGEGVPAVVVDGGIGSPGEEYRQLVDRLAEVTTVVTYDRAGYGSSDAGPIPRDSRREVEELRLLLAGLEVGPPYLLLGHSLGGLNAQVYAGDHPEEVAGLVLLDPPPLGFVLGQDYPELLAMASEMTDEWQAIADRSSSSGSPEDVAESGFFEMLASEHREMFGESGHQASSIETFGDLPLVVVASGVPNPFFGEVAEAYQMYWADQSEQLSAKSRRGQFVFVESSTHRLHADAEDLVIDLVLAMVTTLRDPSR